MASAAAADEAGRAAAATVLPEADGGVQQKPGIMTAGGIRGSLRSRKREGEDGDGPNGGNGGAGGGGSGRGKDGDGQSSGKRSKQDGPRIKLRTCVVVVVVCGPCVQ